VTLISLRENQTWIALTTKPWLLLMVVTINVLHSVFSVYIEFFTLHYGYGHYKFAYFDGDRKFAVSLSHAGQFAVSEGELREVSWHWNWSES